MPDDSNNVNTRDGASIVWGPEIRVDGKRPEWLADRDSFSWYGCSYRGLSHDWAGVKTIRLPADHPYYRQPATPERDPALWDRMEALVRRMAGNSSVGEPYEEDRVISYNSDHYYEARAIVADLPKPIDPDEEEGRRLAYEMIWSIDNNTSIDRVNELAAACVRRGRELAAPEVSHVG